MAKAITPKKLIVYKGKNNKEPFSKWLNNLKEPQVRRRILMRLRRLEQGNYGDCSSVGDSVLELRLFFGSGYRVYFAEDGEELILLLCAGDKSTQDKDIKNAKLYWKDYKENDRAKL